MLEDNRRLTVGVLVGGIMDEFTRYICKGVLQEAKNADVNVLIFPGKYIDRDLSENRDLMYEYQHNTIFSYAKAKSIDALIIAAGSIGCFASEKSIRDMLAQYDGIPCILVASRMYGYISAVFDNYQGIKDGLEYLIEKKGCRKFGMIGGNAENTDAYERKKAFVDTLGQHGIDFNDRMYAEGDLSRRCKKAAATLLDNNPDLEAVFCVNDDTALGFYDEMKRRGLKPGKDIYVFGYDDTTMAAKISPSLSSVRADPSRLGEEAMKMALRVIQGEQLGDAVIPTRFVRRDSVSGTEDEAEASFHFEHELNTSFEDIYYRYCHEETYQEMNSLKACYVKLVDLFLERFEKRNTGIDNNEIMSAVDDFLNQGGIAYADTDNLLIFLEKVYHRLYEKQTDSRQLYELRDVYSAVYIRIIRALNRQIGVMKQTEDKKNYEMKVFVQDMLQFEKGRDQSYGSLLENLDWLDIHDACICALKEPVFHLEKEKFQIPENLYIKAVLQEGKVNTVPVSRQLEKADEVFGSALLQNGKRYDYVVFPLFFKEMVYGILMCNMAESLYTNGEFLVNQVSSATKMITLLQANEKIQSQLEENLAVLKDYNIELDTISKSDVLTGILNRRGFYSEAEQRIYKSMQSGSRVLVIYVDMNNLKIINDRYGHEEGDFALKLIGRFLGEIVGEEGVAGRIGGDEYACAVEYEEQDEGEEFLYKLNQKFENYNARSTKSYNITVSAGACVIKPEEGVSLREALAQADEKLYEVKKHRKKDVEKNI